MAEKLDYLLDFSMDCLKAEELVAESDYLKAKELVAELAPL